ncbi:MAG: SixA phosphatase family protein [Candidatus Latescibacterota bacterium]
MKTIHLVRHAKAVKGSETNDFDRPLEEKGKWEARDVAEKIKSLVKPDALVSSPAVRAIQTAEIFASVLGYPADKIMKRKSLYGQDKNAFRAVIRELGEGIESVMIFGHNPSITEFARTIISGFGDDMPTAGVAALEVDANSWKEAAEGKGRAIFTEAPGKITRSGLQKRRKHDLEGKLAAAIGGVFAESDRYAAEEMQETTLQASKKLAGKFVKKGKPRGKSKPEQGSDMETDGGRKG